MRFGTRAPLVFVLALLLTSLATPAMRASAQDDHPPAEYDGLVDGALEEFDAQHWAEARALFERAHAIHPNARTLRGIGMAAFELRDYVAARRALEGSLAETRRALTAEQRSQVAELVERARVFIGDFRIGPAPAGTTLDVDGVPTTPEGDLGSSATLSLAVGTHELTLRAPDGRRAHAQVTVHGGERASLELAIPDALATPSESAPSEAAPEAMRGPQAPPSTGPGMVPWVLVVGGGVVAIVGAVLLGLGASDAATVTNAARGTEWADLRDAYARSGTLEAAGITGIVVGALVAVGGVIWLAVSEGEGGRAQLGIGPGSLVLRGTF